MHTLDETMKRNIINPPPILPLVSGSHKNSRGVAIEIIDIECGSYLVSVKKLSPQNGGFIRAKLARPRTFCAKANGNF